MRVAFEEVVADIWGPVHPYSSCQGVKGEVWSGGRGFRPRGHQRMMECALERG